MRNSFRVDKLKKGTPMHDPLARHRYWGWLDRLAGLGHRETYDTWDKSAQRNYERGRTAAAIMQAHGFGSIPLWQPTTSWPDYYNRLSSQQRSLLDAEATFISKENL